jgi:tetratricopeptide (TPR) repeat protein
MRRVAINGSMMLIFFLFLTLINLGGDPEKKSDIGGLQDKEIETEVDSEHIQDEQEQVDDLFPPEADSTIEASASQSKGIEKPDFPEIILMNPLDPGTDLIDHVARSRAQSLVKIAQDLCDENLYREGMPWADDALTLAPELAEAHLISGYIHFKLLNTDEAIAAFERTIQLDPVNFDAHLYLGIIYNGNQDPTLALEYLTHAIHLANCPNDISTAYAHRALSYALVQQYDECFNDFDDALYLDPDNGWAIFFRGIVLEELAERERAASEAEGIPGEDLGFTK